jgi:hypothetical protein
LIVLTWLKDRPSVVLFAGMLVLQFLTWREIASLPHYVPDSPPKCSDNYPCTVSIDEFSINQLKR